MNTTVNSTNRTYTMQDLRRKEREVFHTIPGMEELLHAAPDSQEKMLAQYPDAAFDLMVSDNLFCHDRELTEIHRRAYSAILSGENMASIRSRYEEDNKKYLQRHLWDD